MLDFTTPAWHSLRKWCEAELTKARIRNDTATLSDIETASLRGEIKMLKRILDLPNQVAREIAINSEDIPN